MKVFISWSGERSQLLAQALYDWLPMVLQSATPWLSQADIDAGERWADKIAKELEASNFGIICVTRENIASPWVLFEAGALAKLMQDGRVIPLLLDIEFKDVTGPLAQFQAKKVEKEGLLDVVNAVNRLSDVKVSESLLPKQFEVLWPQLHKQIGEIPKNPTPAKQHRPQQEILEELVSSIRGLDMRFRDITDEGPRTRRRRYRYHPGMMGELWHGLDLNPSDPTRFLVLGSFFRDDFPWVYELALEAYRQSRAGNVQKARQAQHQFKNAIHTLRQGPFLDMVASDKEAYYLMREMLDMIPSLEPRTVTKRSTGSRTKLTDEES